MDEFRALQVVAALRSRGVNADLYRENGLFGVRVSLADECEAEFDNDRTGLDTEARRGQGACVRGGSSA